MRSLVESDEIRIEGEVFRSTRLARTLSEADGAVLVAVGAGPEVEQAAQRLWTEDKPDEYFFLETYGSAVVEPRRDEVERAALGPIAEEFIELKSREWATGGRVLATTWRRNSGSLCCMPPR